jgi:predicted MFS family arabinose efflux permease
MKDRTGMATATTRLPLLILICGAAVLALNMGIRQTFGLFLEPVTLDLAMSRSNFALAIAVQNLLWGLLTPACGMLADRYGTGRVLAAGGLLYALGNTVMALGESAFAVHLGAGVMVGMAVGASGFPLVLAVVARSVPEERRSMALAIAATGGSVGQFLLLPFSQVLIEGLGWPAALLILAALAALIVPLAAALAGKPTMAAAGPASLGGALSQARRHRGFLLLTAGFFVCGFHVSFIATHLPGYITSLNLDPLVGASALGLIGFFNILGGLAAGVLGSRFRLKYVLSMIYLARAVAIGLFLFGPKTEWAVFAFSAVIGLLWLSTVPLTSSLVGQIFGSRFMATLFGIVMLGHQLGAFFGAWLGGLSYDLTGSYDGVWILSILLGLLAAALHWPIADRPLAAQPAAAETNGVA